MQVLDSRAQLCPPTIDDVRDAFATLSYVLNNIEEYPEEADALTFGAQSVVAACLCRVEADPLRTAVLDVLNDAIRTGHIRLTKGAA